VPTVFSQIVKNLDQPRVPKGSSKGGQFASKAGNLPAPPTTSDANSQKQIHLIHNLASKIVTDIGGHVKSPKAYLAFGKPSGHHDNTTFQYYNQVHGHLFGKTASGLEYKPEDYTHLQPKTEEGFKTNGGHDIFGGPAPLGQNSYVHDINTAVENHHAGIWSVGQALQHISNNVTAEADPKIKDYANAATKHLMAQKAPEPVKAPTNDELYSALTTSGHGITKPNLNGNAQQMNAWGKKLATVDHAYQQALAGGADPESIINTAQPNKTAHPKVHAYFNAVKAKVIAAKIATMKPVDPAGAKVLEVKKPHPVSREIDGVIEDFNSSVITGHEALDALSEIHHQTFGDPELQAKHAKAIKFVRDNSTIKPKFAEVKKPETSSSSIEFNPKDGNSSEFPGASSHELDSVNAVNSALVKLKTGQWSKDQALNHISNWANYNHPAVAEYTKQVKAALQGEPTKTVSRPPTIPTADYNNLKNYEQGKVGYIDSTIESHQKYLKGYTLTGTNKQDTLKTLTDLTPPGDHSQTVKDYHAKAVAWVNGASTEAAKPLATSLAKPDEPVSLKQVMATSSEPAKAPVPNVPKPASSHAATQAQIDKIETAFKSGSPSLIAKVTPGKSAQKQVKDYHAAMLKAHEAGKQGNVLTATGLKPAADISPKPVKSLAEKLASLPPASAGLYVVTSDGATTKFEKITGQLGSNAGGVYADPSGAKHYVKFQKSEDHAANETLASRLYKLAGSDAIEVHKVPSNHGPTTITKWQDGLENLQHSSSSHKKLADEDFGTHAWLGNWDAIGQTFDNQKFDPNTGKMKTVDVGGSMFYRAQGEKKPFLINVDELSSLKSQSLNPQASAIFGMGKLTDTQLEAMKKIALLDDAEIHAVAAKYASNGIAGMSSEAIGKRLVDRKNYIAQEWAKATGKNLDDLMAEKKQVKVSPPPSTLPGALAEHALNMKKIAQSGDLDKLAAYKVDDLQTHWKTADYAGYKAFKEYKKQLESIVQTHLNSAPPPHVELEHHATLTPKLAAQHPSMTLESVPTHHAKLYDYAIVGKSKAVPSAEDLKDNFHNIAVTSQADSSYSEEHKMLSSSTPQAMALKKALKAGHAMAVADPTFGELWSSYKGSGYSDMNTAWRKGDFTSHYGKQVKTMLGLLSKHSVELPEGMVLHRGISMPDQLHLTKFKQNIGSIIQEPSLASTSWGANAAFSGHNTQMHIHLTKGVRGMSAKGAGIETDSEREIVLLPGTRYLISRVEKKGAQTHVHVLALPASQFENVHDT
jgi:hypothetical protein